MLSRKLMQALISGYSRGNSNDKTPDDLITIILHFYDSDIIWNVKTPQIKMIESSSSHFGYARGSNYFNAHTGPTWTIEGIKFGLQITHSSSGNIAFQTVLKSPSSIVDQVEIKFRLQCIETKTDYRGHSILYAEPELNINYAEWEHGTLNSDECSLIQDLTFICGVEILSIKYSNQSNYIIKPIALNSSNEIIKYEWKIDDDMLFDFEKCKNGKLIWAPTTFGNGGNFCAWIAPNGQNSGNKGCCIFGIKILALPHDLNGIVMKCLFELHSNVNNFHLEYKRNVYVGDDSGMNLCLKWKDYILKKQILLSLREMIFSVTVQI